MEEDSRTILQIANNASFGDKKNASVIDVDVISNNPKQDFIENNKEILDQLHSREKEVFFPLLSDKFLSSLNPTY